MMRPGPPARLAGLAAAAALASGCAANDSFPAPSQASATVSAPTPQSYLDAGALAELAGEIAAFPAPGSSEDAADRAASSRWTALEDSDRWRLAQSHAEVRPHLAVQHFDCPLRTRLAEAPPPALVLLLSRSLRDAGTASNAAKDAGFRARPIVDDPDRRACIRVDDGLRASASHPSGHATVGALWGRIMADVAPDQAQALIHIGDQIGVSREICAVHYPSDVAAGQALGRALYEDIRRTPAYQQDVAAARTEVAEARALGRLNPGCAAERAALALPPLDGPEDQEPPVRTP